jgi:peptidoglycan/LPS O-acetylase OafA/YrhL
MTRYRLLDALRGISCLAVVICHAGTPLTQLSGAYAPEFANFVSRLDIGVLCFFVISGYCITASGDRLIAKNQFACSTFLLRRFRRIYPAYWACLALSFILSKVVPWDCPLWAEWSSRFSGSLDQWIGNITLTELWRPYVTSSKEHLFLPHAWSLCYEEQFYAVVAVSLLFGPPFIRLLWLVTLSAVSVYVWEICTGNTGGFRLFFDYHWCYFALGVGSYWSVRHHWEHLRKIGWSIVALGIIALPVGSVYRLEPLVRFSLASLCAGLMMICRQDDSRLCRTNVGRLLVWIGGFSYSLYLVHPLVTVPVAAAVLPYVHEAPYTIMGGVVILDLLVSIGIALVFSRFFEKPFVSERL